MKLTAPVLVLLVAGLGHTAATAADERLFPRPESLEPAIGFWTRVYTEIDTNSGFIHDSKNLAVVYGRVDLGNTRSSRQRHRQIDEARDRYRAILEHLADGHRENLTSEQRRILELWPDDVGNAELERATQRLRFQLGQADRFLAGLRRSGAYRRHIERVLREKDLPEQLAALPHVESSFDPTAYSRVGAAGMWQFTRSTGQRYMRIDHIIDERRDPFMSTYAAAQLLKDNYAVLDSWPLALTAYNHGQAGMRRAAREQGTKDIGAIIENYDGRYFGFASRNFYPAFVAAMQIDANPERYFDAVELEPSTDTALAEVPAYIGAGALARALGVDVGTLRVLNPALLDTVWEGDKLVPKGFELRLPAAVAADAGTRLAALPAGELYAAQRPDIEHRVRSGDTLSEIAEQYGIGLSALLRANNLGSRNVIRAGQTLTLPVQGDAAQRRVAQATAAADSSGADAASDGEYVVRRGDTIEVIAARLDVDANALVAANDIRDEDRIFPGQVLDVAALTSAGGRLAAERAAEPDPRPTPEPAQPERASPSADPAPALVSAGGPAADSPAGAARGKFDATGATAAVAAAARTAPEAPGTDGTVAETSGVATVQARLAADPSDYSVAEDGTIEVNSLETLGHYADWLEIRTQRLRDVNGFRFGRAVVIGERIELDFSNIERTEFEQRRLAYQERLQESFFSSYRIADVVDHVVRPGESLWLLAQRRYDVPVWLLRQYNPDLDLDRVRPGTVVKFPELTRVTDESVERRAVSSEGELG